MQAYLTVTMAGIGLLAAGVGWAQNYPDTTIEGLPRIEHKRLDAVYWQPEATLDGYTKVIIEVPEVAFRKNWQRDQNRNRGVSDRVTTEYMQGVRADLARRFVEIFTEELEAGGYAVVAEAGEGVLLLRPGIIDLDVYAPDVMAPFSITTYTTSAGRMTLQMDLLDSATEALIGRVIDRRRARENFTGQVTNSVTNRVEGDRMLRRWAQILRDSLAAKGG